MRIVGRCRRGTHIDRVKQKSKEKHLAADFFPARVDPEEFEQKNHHQKSEANQKTVIINLEKFIPCDTARNKSADRWPLDVLRNARFSTQESSPISKPPGCRHAGKEQNDSGKGKGKHIRQRAADDRDGAVERAKSIEFNCHVFDRKLYL